MMTMSECLNWNRSPVGVLSLTPELSCLCGRLKDYLLMCRPAPKSALFTGLFGAGHHLSAAQAAEQPSRLSPPLWWHHNFSANSELWP